MSSKKSFLLVSLIVAILIAAPAKAELIYAGGSGGGPNNVVYKYSCGTSWEEISQDLGTVLCLCVYEGRLYAGTTTAAPAILGSQADIGTESLTSKKQLLLSRALSSTEIGQVWRYDGGTEWTRVDPNLDNQVCSLIVFRGNLYAGTTWGSGRLYRYDGGTKWTKVVDYTRQDGDPPTPWNGFRSLYVWNDLLYIGDIGHDLFGHYDGNKFTYDDEVEHGSCVWDFEAYDSNLYASSYHGRVHKSSDGRTWTTIRDFQGYNSWELETFQGYLYVTTGPNLERYDGNNFSTVWTEKTEPNGYEIISMISTGDALILGTGEEAGSGEGVPGIGKVYSYDGNDVQLISGDMGSGIQALLVTAPVQLKKVDVNEPNCIGPGDYITYTIDFNYPTDPNMPVYNEVNIIDYLPPEVDFTPTLVSTDFSGDGFVDFVDFSIFAKAWRSTTGSAGWDPNCDISIAADGIINYADLAVFCDNWLSTPGIYDPGLPRKVTWNIGILHPGTAGSVTLKVKVKPCVPPCITITNECVIESNGVPIDGAYEDTAVCCPTLSKTDINDGNCVIPDDYITYNIRYNANGYSDTNVIITDYLPEEVDFNSASGNGQHYPDSNTVVWNIDTLEPNESDCVTLIVRVNENAKSESTFINDCNLTSGDHLLARAAEDTNVCPFPILTKVDVNDGNCDCVSPGVYITYDIRYDANGYSDTNVIITDYLPEEVDFNSASGNGQHYPDSNTVVWNIDTLEPNESDCVTLIVRVNENAEPNTRFINPCELTSDGQPLARAAEDTNVCYWRCCLIYVDANAIGDNNGTSWQNAYKYLQDALSHAEEVLFPSGPWFCVEVRVADGNYRPDEGLAVEPNDRQATFGLINNVSIYGGYAGDGAPDPNARDPNLYKTILSGDLDGDDTPGLDPCDLPNDPNRGENSYHVVTASDTNSTAILDGFTITAGNANGGWIYNYGGGMYNYDGSPTITDCNFTRNSAYSGGGMYDYEGSSPIVSNCTFSGNSATEGGGMYNSGPSASSDPDIINCIFIGNSATSSGGGMCNGGYSNPNIINCIFIENSADSGGGMYNDDSNSTITNCIFTGNSAVEGGGINMDDIATITNCILWGNEGGQIHEGFYGDVNVTYSDIQCGWPGIGNIDEDPMLEPNDYHLTLCSPCIDAGTNYPVGGLPATDIDGEPRVGDGDNIGEAIVDMGVDECYLTDVNARRPKPANTAIVQPLEVTLMWRPGDLVQGVNGHEVYFGTNEDDVRDANTTSHPNVALYIVSDPCVELGTLEFATEYYWRVDEVNKAYVPGPNDPPVPPNGRWKGDVWNFTTTNYLVIDDFDRYFSRDELRDVWKDGYSSLLNGSNITLSTEMDSRYYFVPPWYQSPPNEPPIHEGNALQCEDALQFVYDNDKSIWIFVPGYDACKYNVFYYYSEMEANIFDLECVSDWTVLGVTSLSLWFYGDPCNAVGPNEQMYIALEDTDGDPALLIYGDSNGEDVNKLLSREWTEWPIGLQRFPNENPDFNLTDVNKVYIGFGERYNNHTMGGYGIVYFDSIRLLPPETIGKFEFGPSADSTRDFVIDFRDFSIMINEWLEDGCLRTDLNEEDSVDFKDLVMLTDKRLLGPILFPEL